MRASALLCCFARFSSPPRMRFVTDAPKAPEPANEPSAEHLERVAVPARVRRAPRFGRIVGMGGGLAAAAGVLCGLLLPNSTGVGRGMVAIVVGLAFALFGALIAGLIAVLLDRGTAKYLKNAPPTNWPQDKAQSADDKET